MKKITTLFLLLLTLIISCKEEKRKLIIENNKMEIKKYSLPNDEFREKVLYKIRHENDKKKFITLLNSLDKKNLSFCDFVKREFEIDDSCYSIALKRYPKPEMQIDFMKAHDEVYDIAQKKILNQIEFSNRDANFLTIAYSFDQNIKNFCGKY
ncbi:hypothetical protein [Chryseobacterium paridis]|uniref:Lipoprotein n=1 Tax=Chryseobacterium paridis TaxID=2800328 RepID=A0ABS1FTE8_9FLAO|nr:hypothetical protein [Chryseobacterium paridis]MBK1895701.1 hypothetical protein [Chryseobacterium paridis]